MELSFRGVGVDFNILLFMDKYWSIYPKLCLIWQTL